MNKRSANIAMREASKSGTMPGPQDVVLSASGAKDRRGKGSQGLQGPALE